MQDFVDHYWHGSPAAMEAALAAIPAGAERVGPVEQPGLDGQPVAFVLVRAADALPTPAGLAVTPAWIGLAAVGVIA